MNPAVFCFPGAGSFGAEFRELLRSPDTHLVRYPGRFGRAFGQCAGSFRELVDSCADQVHTGAILAGHSFGAYLAFAVAAQLGASTLVVSGANAPHLAQVPPELTTDRAALAAYLDTVEPASSPEWTEVVLDTATQDLRLLQEFLPTEYSRLDCPVRAARGEYDPLTSLPGLRAWHHATSGGTSVREFPGGHSDLVRTPGFADWLRAEPLLPQRLSKGA